MERKKGREYVDEQPVEWPLGVSVPESLEQKIARMVRVGVSQHAHDVGAETFDEADDFDVQEDDGPTSPHELDDDQLQIMRDLDAVRRIPPQFRAAFERDQARRRSEAEAALKQRVETSTVDNIDSPGKTGKSSPA